MDTASAQHTPLGLLYFFLQLQLEKVFLISSFVTIVRFINLFFFSPLTKNTERKLMKEDLSSQPNKIHQLNCLHTPFLAIKGNRNVFNINSFLFQATLSPIISSLLESMVVCVDNHHSSAMQRNLKSHRNLMGSPIPP